MDKTFNLTCNNNQRRDLNNYSFEEDYYNNYSDTNIQKCSWLHWAAYVRSLTMDSSYKLTAWNQVDKFLYR